MKTIMAALALALILSVNAFAAMTQGVPDNAKAEFAKGNIRVTDTFKARLYVTASTNMSIGMAAPGLCNSTGELTGGNYTVKDLTVSPVTMDTTNHGAIWTITSPAWGPTFTAAHVDGMAICDYTLDGTNGVLVAYYTFADTPVTNGTLTVQVPAATYAAGLLVFK